MPLYFQLQGNLLVTGTAFPGSSTALTPYEIKAGTAPEEPLTILNGTYAVLLPSGTVIQFGATQAASTGALTLTDFSGYRPTDGTFAYTTFADYNDPLLLAAFAGQAQIFLPAELRFMLPGTTTWVRSTNAVTLTVDAPVLSNADASPFATTAKLAAAQALIAFAPLVTSAGDGASTSLEAVPTANLPAPLLRTLYLPNSDQLQDWLLYPSTAVTAAAGGILRPNDYNATTNEKVWFLKRST